MSKPKKKKPAFIIDQDTGEEIPATVPNKQGKKKKKKPDLTKYQVIVPPVEDDPSDDSAPDYSIPHGVHQMNSIFGMRFPLAIVERMRSDDLVLKILMNLEEHGFALVNARPGALPGLIQSQGQEYWTVFISLNNPNRSLIVLNEQAISTRMKVIEV